MWKPTKGIKETREYQKDIKKLKLHKRFESDLVSSIKRWILSEQDLLLSFKKSTRLFASDDGGIEVFIVRLSDQSTDSGNSGGYRLIMIYKIKEHIAEIGRIFKRKDLKYKGSKGKKTKEYEKYIQELRKEFNPKIKTQNTPDITIKKSK